MSAPSAGCVGLFWCGETGGQKRVLVRINIFKIPCKKLAVLSQYSIVFFVSGGVSVCVCVCLS